MASPDELRPLRPRRSRAASAVIGIGVVAILASGGALAIRWADRVAAAPVAVASSTAGAAPPSASGGSATVAAAATPGSRPGPTASTDPAPRPSPSPATGPLAPPAGPVDLNLAPDGEKVFSSQITKEMCAPAGVTSALATMSLVTASNATQRAIESGIDGWTSKADSHNGGWGPLAMTRALAAYGAPGYVVMTFPTRDAALRTAAIAISATREPVLLLAWWGAHTWVMTGYRATGDLAAIPGAVVTGAYIVDPWYPRVSSIWGHVNPPGHFYDLAGMKRNYIAWTRPEGRYPGRDGRWVAVIPTYPLPGPHGDLPVQGQRPLS